MRGQVKMASHPLQLDPVNALVPEKSEWREYADEGRDLDDWSKSLHRTPTSNSSQFGG